MKTKKHYCEIGMCHNEVLPFERVCDECMAREQEQSEEEFEFEFAESEHECQEESEDEEESG